MLDYKSIIIKRYALKMSYKELAEEFSASKSGINDFMRAFEKCEKFVRGKLILQPAVRSFFSAW